MESSFSTNMDVIISLLIFHMLSSTSVLVPVTWVSPEQNGKVTELSLLSDHFCVPRTFLFSSDSFK